MTSSYDIMKSILAIDANAKCRVDEDDPDRITWTSTPISKADILAKQTELKAAYDAKKYQRDRAVAYDPIKEQLDQLYWDKKNGTNKWVEAIDKVKSDNPKP